MTEEEAINDLTNMVTGQQQETPQGETPPQEATEPKAEEQTETPQAETKEQSPDIKIDVAKIIQEQQKTVAEQNKKIAELESKVQPQEQPNEEQQLIQEAQAKLGIDQQKMQKLYEMQAQQEKINEFNSVVSEFEKEHPDIDLKEMGQWAKDNNLEQLLNNPDVNQWNVVANAMKAVAKVTAKPDNITPSSQKGAEQTVWEKMDKGEKVDDIDLGIDLLKGVGGWE